MQCENRQNVSKNRPWRHVYFEHENGTHHPESETLFHTILRTQASVFFCTPLIYSVSHVYKKFSYMELCCQIVFAQLDIFTLRVTLIFVTTWLWWATVFKQSLTYKIVYYSTWLYCLLFWIWWKCGKFLVIL